MNKFSSGWQRGLIWLATVLLMGAYLSVTLKLVSNIGQFMPEDTRFPQLQVLQGELEHGPAATILLVSLHGGPDSELVRLSRGLVKTIKPAQSEIASIQNGSSSLDLDSLQALHAVRYLLVDEDWSAAGLHRAMLQRLDDLRSGAGPLIGQRMLSDPYLSLLTYIKGIGTGSGPGYKDGVWFDKTMGALLMVKVKGNALNLDRMQSAIHTLRTSLVALKPAAPVKMDIAGPGEMAVSTRAAIQTTIRQLSWVMLILLVAVFWFAYRSLSLMLLAVIPLLSGTLVGMTATQLIFGHVHGIVMAFGVTLLGMCMDYPLHLFSHCRRDESAHAAMRRIWPTLSLGGVSSAIAFLVLLGGGFEGLSQLALFAASGVMAALLVTRYFLPYWVAPARIRPRYLPLPNVLPGYLRGLIVLLVLSIPLLTWFRAGHLWENRVDAISPIPAQARELDGRLRAAMAAPEVSHLFVVEGRQLDGVLTKTEQLVQALAPLKHDKIVDDVLAVTRLLPSHATQQRRQGQIPPGHELEARVVKAVQDTPFKAASFDPFVQQAEQMRRHPLIGMADLTVPLLKTMMRQDLIKTPDGWLSLIRLSKVRSDAALLGWLRARPDLARYHIQMKQAVSELMQSYREAALVRMELALLLLVVLVWLALRRTRRMLRIILPVILSVAASLCIPLLAGQGLTVFHLLAALLVIGMGLDYSLFFNRKTLIEEEHQQSMHAIAISMLTTVVAFSVLAVSPIPVMSAMGSVIAVGIFLCFFLAWVLAREPVS